MWPKALLKEYSHLIAIFLCFMDMFALIAGAYLSYFLRFGSFELPSTYISAVLIATLMMPALFSFFSIYTSVRGRGFFLYFCQLIQAICVLWLILAGLAFFTKTGDIFSRTWFILWLVAASGFLIIFRFCLLLCLRFMRSRGLNERRVVIFGANELGIKFAQAVHHALWTGFRIHSFIDDHPENITHILTIPVIATPDQLSDYLQTHQIDELWIALALSEEARVKEILYELRHQTLTLRFLLDIFGLDLLHHSITEIAGFPVLNIRTTPMSGINRLIKALEDRILSALILLLISPLLALIAVGVKLSSTGPIFFIQERLGWDGRIIKIYKFRTMVLHNETAGTLTQASRDDQRVTKFGKLLRRTSLDELPQFINVLQGRMSIVGPRPHALAHNEQYKDLVHTYMQRHRVKPGITGWAQINGWRGETDTLDKMKKRVEFDLHYINHWSLSFDLKIIFLTFLRGFFHRNAY